jgi:alkylation response protein AidB-like acyl-CoA dehydrogenase
MGVIKSELVGTANWSWGMYPGLSMGCMNTLMLHGSEEMKQKYLTKLAEGVWTGTMCLTEPQCGTDLGQVKTSAAPAEDGTYRLNGTKIFISCGEHDMSENIVHIVLARIPGSPEGTKGISLFLVPKYLFGKDGKTLDTSRKNLQCARLEDKMGIKASATSVMEFEGSVGYLIGKQNDGLHQMFTFMNTARLGTGLQGIGAAECAYQAASAYAKDRTSLRALSGTKYPQKPADPLIVHPDIRRMLLHMRAVTEGGRALLYDAALLGDYWLVDGKDAKEKAAIEDYLGFHTPIVKGFLTEMGLEAASHGIQVYGGHGFIKGNGVEQIYRDARIATLYEGTTGIQALDLLGRKTLMKKMKHLNKYTNEIRAFASPLLWDSRLGPYAREMVKRSLQWQWYTFRIALKASKDKEVVNAACVDYLYYSGYVSMGHHWLKMAAVASKALQKGNAGADQTFYENKLHTAEYYFSKLMPRADSHAKAMLTGTKGLMGIKDEDF